MGAKNNQKLKIPLIGLLALKNLFITKKDLQQALLSCSGKKNLDLALKDYFLSKELISSRNMNRLSRAAKALGKRQKEFKFGAIAIRKGFINQSVLKLALGEQADDIKNKRKVRRIGDLLVDAGMLSTKQRDYILRLQKRTKQENSQISQVPETKNTADEGKIVSGNQKMKVSKGPSGIVGDTDEKDVGLLEPEIIEGGITLVISKDFMAAFFLKTDQFDRNVTLQEIKAALFDKGIVLGIVVDEMIEGFINSSGFKSKPFRIAKGVPPIRGKDARVEFFFNADYLKAGGMTNDGVIDFKDRGEIPFVEEGTVLAEKIPMVESSRGRNIFGDEMETIPGKDIPLKCGKGAKLSEDGFKVLADVPGFPKYTLSGHIFVHQEYMAEGDVDYETGHISYDGNVNIKGRIKSGFKVKGNEVKTVEIDGGTVDADGDVKVTGGINEGKIFARGNVYAKFIHNSEIVCMGNVIVQKEIVDTEVESSGSCVVENGKIIASKITAKMGVKAQHIGTQMSVPGTIIVGHDVFTEKELEKIKENLGHLEKQAAHHQENKEKLKEENLALQKEITEFAHVQDRTQLKEREINSTIDSMQEEPANSETIDDFKQTIEQLRLNAQKAEEELDVRFEKSEEIEDLLKKEDREIEILAKRREDFIEERTNLVQWSNDNPGKPLVVVQGTIMAGTLIRGKHCEKQVNELIRHSRIMEVLTSPENTQDKNAYEMQVSPI